jgi:uncharacterized phiE125 gp8 family phage protein
MGLTLITAPAQEPVTVEEAKAHLRETSNDSDELIRSLIIAARQYVEKRTARQLVTATWELSLDELQNQVELPLPPLVSITSVKYTNADGVVTTVATTVYEITSGLEPGFLRLAYNQIWPTDYLSFSDVWKIRYVAGYGAASVVPEAIKAAIKLYVAHLYENREPYITGSIVSDVPDTIDALIGAYSLGKIR